jgi:hypothetical protein
MHGIEKVGFGLTGIAWNVGSYFLPDWNGLEGRKSFCPDWNSLDWSKSVLA